MGTRGGGDGMIMPPDDSMGGDGYTPMHSSFFWGSHVQILFAGWPGDRGLGMYILALLAVFATAALVDALSLAIQNLSKRRFGPRRVSMALLIAAVHALRVGLAYLVMLAVMSFNIGVLIAAIAGHAVGSLISGSGFFGLVSTK
ncbi:copper transporter 6-like [Zingiber officinale]|nr:copper transporter 6-like [Zingiber officinale]